MWRLSSVLFHFFGVGTGFLCHRDEWVLIWVSDICSPSFSFIADICQILKRIQLIERKQQQTNEPPTGSWTPSVRCAEVRCFLGWRWWHAGGCYPGSTLQTLSRPPEYRLLQHPAERGNERDIRRYNQTDNHIDLHLLCELDFISMCILWDSSPWPCCWQHHTLPA